jgi:hypothetical protein
MVDSMEAKLEAIMDTKMDGLEREIMEGLKKFLIERNLKVKMYPTKFMMRTQGR